MSFYRPGTDVFICAPSVYLPRQVMTNEDVLAWMQVSVRPEWISKRTGIEKRYWAAEEEAVSDLAVHAAEALFQKHPEERANVRQLVLATVSGDYPTPPTSPLVQDRLGLRNTGCFDLGAACAGFATGLHTAAALCEGTGETQLVVASEIRSKFLAKRDLATVALFGDGAAACLVKRNSKCAAFRFEAGELLSDGSVADLISIEAGGSRLPFWRNGDPANQFLAMKRGSELFLKAAEGMRIAAQSLLQKVDLPLNRIDWLVPHQANLHLIREVTRQLGLEPEKVIETVRDYGNTSGSSVGIALHSLCESGRLHAGDRVLLVSAGGGGLAATILLEGIPE